jgi:hypothetical protein
MRTFMACSVIVLVGCAGRPPVQLQDAEVVSHVTAAGAAPMIALAPSGARSVAWIAAPDAGSDGRLYVSTDGAQPSELRDSSGGIEPHGEAPPKLSYGPDGTLFALYAVGRLEAGRRFPFTTLRLAASHDGGRTWDTPRTVTGDSIPRSRNFHALHAATDGSIYVAWLESRGDSGSRTYLTRSTDQGMTWSRAVRVAEGESCPCCRVAIATGEGGRMFLAWRAVLPGNVRDIVVATSSDYGATWSSPVRVHDDGWVFEGCPHAGPSMVVDPAGTLHIAWWTGREGSSGAFYANSVDSARTFRPRLALGESHLTMPAHVQLAIDGRGTVLAAWDDGRDTLPRVMLRVSRDGGASFSREVLVGEPGVASAFPVIALHDGDFTIAWSERSAESHAHEEHSRPDMSKPGSVMPLLEVGAQRVLVRRGRIN